MGIWRSNRWMVWLFGGLSLFAAGFIVGIAGTQPDWLTDFAENFWIEVLGILVTVLVIDRIYAANSVKDRKVQLFNQLKSRVNVMAIHALEQIRHEGWLEAALHYHKRHKDEQPDFRVLSWQGALLNGIRLVNVDLRSSKFIHADLRNADLRGCDLAFCDLTDSFIGNTDLRGADLYEAVIDNVRIASKEPLDSTKLPDGSSLDLNNPNVDARRFTDPQHPAYRETREKINKLRSEMGMKPLRE